jgi:hypothetical protein
MNEMKYKNGRVAKLHDPVVAPPNAPGAVCRVGQFAALASVNHPGCNVILTESARGHHRTEGARAEECYHADDAYQAAATLKTIQDQRDEAQAKASELVLALEAANARLAELTSKPVAEDPAQTTLPIETAPCPALAESSPTSE